MMTAERMSMARFAEMQGPTMRGPVADQTGLKGTYDFTIDLSKYVRPDTPPDDMIAAPSQCLQHELGLIEARKLPLEILVVDQAEKTPVENWIRTAILTYELSRRGLPSRGFSMQPILDAAGVDAAGMQPDDSSAYLW